MKRAILKHHEIADQIRGHITQFGLAAGKRLPSENELAAMLGASRPSIRSGLLALSLAGEIEIKPGRASYVRRHDEFFRDLFTDMGPLEILKARITIECKLAAEAATNATCEGISQLDTLLAEMQRTLDARAYHAARRAFHRLIAAVARQPVAGKIASQLIDQMSFGCATSVAFEAEISEHLAILTAIALHDARGAASSMRAHLLRVEERLKDLEAPVISPPPVHTHQLEFASASQA